MCTQFVTRIHTCTYGLRLHELLDYLTLHKHINMYIFYKITLLTDYLDGWMDGYTHEKNTYEHIL